MSPRWNRCDVCGKFISYKDFDDGLAFRYMKTPDTIFTAETYETLCKEHNPRVNVLAEKMCRVKGVVKMAEEWCNKQLMPEGQICMAALKDIRRIVNG